MQADVNSICSHVLHDSVALALDGCRFGWAALVFKCFTDHGKDVPLAHGVPVEVHSHQLVDMRPSSIAAPWLLML